MNELNQQLSPQPELETSRLQLRPFLMTDAADVQRICSDREIAANTRTIEHPYPAGAAACWIEQHASFWEQGKAAIFAICCKCDTRVLGAIGLEVNSEEHHAEIGYWIEDVHRGKGFATEAVKAVIPFGFAQLGLYRIFAHHLSRNPGSGKVMLNAGMIHEGSLRGHTRKWGVFEDIEIYGILRSDLGPKEAI